MTEIMIVGTGMIMTAVAVAVGGVALEAVLRVLRRALQPSPLGTSIQPGADGQSLRFSYAGSPINDKNWAREEPMTAKEVPDVHVETADRMPKAQEHAGVRRSATMKVSSALPASAHTFTRGHASLRRVRLDNARKWIGGQLIYPHPVSVVRTRIR